MNNLYLYFAKPSEETKYYITNVLNPIKFEMINSNLFSVVVDDIEIASEAINAASQEFYIDVVCYISYIDVPLSLHPFISDYLKSKRNGVFSLVDVIEYYVLTNNTPFKDEIKKYFSSKLSKEVIDTGLVFIKLGNSIAASKELYIHRNTLNYRIETIKKITSLDLKYFKDQLAFYGLFH